MGVDQVVANQFRAAFDARPGKKISGNFEVLLSAFSERSCNFAAIARQYGVTTKAVLDLYHTYFEAIVGKSAYEIRRQREQLKPEDLTIGELRARYEGKARRRGKIRLSYDEFLALVANPANDFASIARSLGVCKETVWAYYWEYFQPVLKASGLERLETARETEREELVRELPNGHGALGIVARAAEKAGLTVQRTPKWGPRFELRECALRVEDFLCRVHHLKSVRQYSRTLQRYVRATFTLMRKVPYDAHLLYIDVSPELRRILVIPAYVLNRIAGRGPTVDAHIPVERRPTYHNIKPRVDWLKYENAWHLLGNEDYEEGFEIEEVVDEDESESA